MKGISLGSSNMIKVYLVYGILFLLFMFKMFFYANEIMRVPDQMAHLSYVVYMEDVMISAGFEHGGNVLDVGCGDQPYRFLFKEPYMKDIDYIPMDEFSYCEHRRCEQ